MNANWDRWALQSFIKYLETTFASGLSWPLYILGVSPGEETDFLNLSSPVRLAASIDTAKRQRGTYEYWLEVRLTLILTTTYDQSDVFLHSRKVGVLESLIPTCLDLKRWGEVSETVFCTVNLLDDIEPRPYPSIGPTTRVSQSVYTLDYKGPVDGTD